MELGFDVFMCVFNISVFFCVDVVLINMGNVVIFVFMIIDVLLWNVVGNMQIFDVIFIDLGGGNFSYDVIDY